MLNLVRLSLAYHSKTLLVAWGIALGVAAMEILAIWIRSEAGEFHLGYWLWLLVPGLGLVASTIAGVVALGAEGRERRLLLHLPLPVTRTQVGLARVVFPALVIVLGTAAAVLLSILVGRGEALTAARAWNLLLAGTQLTFFLQVVLTVEELLARGRRLPGRLMGVVALVLLLGISLLAWIGLTEHFASHLVLALATAGFTLGLVGLTVFLFHRRVSFIGG